MVRRKVTSSTAGSTVGAQQQPQQQQRYQQQVASSCSCCNNACSCEDTFKNSDWNNCYQLQMSIGIKANVAGIGIPASSIPVQYRSIPVPDWVSLFRYRTGSGIGGIFFLPMTPKNSASVNKNKARYPATKSAPPPPARLPPMQNFILWPCISEIVAERGGRGGAYTLQNSKIAI